jgi:hypothetical protein
MFIMKMTRLDRRQLLDSILDSRCLGCAAGPNAHLAARSDGLDPGLGDLADALAGEGGAARRAAKRLTL